MTNKRPINNVITCGVRRGYGATPFTDLSLNNNIAILFAYHKNVAHFHNANKKDLIALKDGHSIIAVGRYKERFTSTWDQATEENMEIYDTNEKIQLADTYNIDLEQKIIVLEVEEWIVLDPPIYYPNRQSTVIIQQEDVKQACIDRFEGRELDYSQKQLEYSIGMAKSLVQESDHLSVVGKNPSEINTEKKDKLNQALQYIEQIIKNDKNHIDGLSLQKDIKTKLLFLDDTIQIQNTVAEIFLEKANKLRTSNKWYIGLFIGTILLLVSGLALYMTINKPTVNTNIWALVITQLTTISTIIASVFWLAKFFNRRIHENVHLMEEYEFRALLFSSCQNMKKIHPDHENKYLEKIINVASDKITCIFHRNKGDLIPIEVLEKVNQVKPVSKSDTQ